MMRKSKSSPPRNVSPLVESTSSTAPVAAGIVNVYADGDIAAGALIPTYSAPVLSPNLISFSESIVNPSAATHARFASPPKAPELLY